MSFHIGQLVVCVDDGKMRPEWRQPGKNYFGGLHGLTRGTVYTVREVNVLAWDGSRNCIRIFEIVRPSDGLHDADQPYSAGRFRAIDYAKIEVFRRIAASPRKRIRVGEDA